MAMMLEKKKFIGLPEISLFLSQRRLRELSRPSSGGIVPAERVRIERNP